MERQELFNEVKSWLEVEKISFCPDPEDATFQGWTSTANGMTLVTLFCEDAPPAIQIVCTLPIKVPKDKVAEAALFLHNLNACLRIGAFYLNPEQRQIVFRLTMPVRPEAKLSRQFDEAFGTALGTWNDHLPPLALLLSSTKAAKETVAKLAPARRATQRLPKSRRLELN